MTHQADDITAALRLLASGLTAAEVSRRTGIPRRTVADWVAGRIPRRRSPTACTACDGAPHDYERLPDIYAYLLGLYLGDGYIASHRRGVHKLRITLDAAYPGIVDECAAAMRLVLPKPKVARLHRTYGDVEIYSYSRAWPCLLPQHGPGKKHLRRILLEDWQRRLVQRAPELMLRGLIHSDGCRFVNTGRNWVHPRYSFSNLSLDIQQIFRDTCELIGLRTTTAGHNTVYVSRKADVAVLDEFIGPKA